MKALFAITAIVTVCTVTQAAAQPRVIATNAPASNLYMPVKSFVDLRFRGLVRQTEDLSCGAAALATLLQYYFDRPVTEREVIDDILENVSDEKRNNIDQFGFSLLELKQAGERNGLFGGGFRLNGVESLEKLKAPVIALTNVRGYAHFVVVRGAKNGKVFVADPAFGNRTQGAEEFAREWDGVVLTLIDTDAELKDTEFMTDHALYARADTLVSLWRQNRLLLPKTGTEF